jgi:hypothetical protein
MPQSGKRSGREHSRLRALDRLPPGCQTISGAGEPCLIRLYKLSGSVLHQCIGQAVLERVERTGCAANSILTSIAARNSRFRIWRKSSIYWGTKCPMSKT